MDIKFRSLSKQAADCQRYIQRLNNIDSISIQEEIASLIRNEIRRLEKDIENVKILADEEDRQSTRNQILNRLGEYETQCIQLQNTARQAILKSKQRVTEKEQENRKALFGNRNSEGNFTEQYELLKRNSKGNNESLLRATSNVTDALRRTSTLMQQELEKSTYSANTLADSSKTLSATLSEYENLGSLLTLSKRMITHLETSDWIDRIILFFGITFFCLVVLYIIKKRTWDVGVSWINWISSFNNNKKAIISSSSLIPSPTSSTTISSSTTTTKIISAATNSIINNVILVDPTATPPSAVIHTWSDEL
ncbi:Sec20-domain-containing protein [Cunninghamella echinulata]|nr:Sec20-domain-containing protein [Cunninghamella echinulata]